MADTKVEETAAPKSGGNKLIIIMMVFMLLMMIGMGVLAFLFMSKGSESDTPALAETEEGVEATSSDPEIYYTFAPAFIINLQHQGRQRHVQIGLSVMSRDQGVIDALETHMPVVRNDLVLMFSSQTYEDFASNEGKIAIRDKTRGSLQSIMKEKIGEDGIEEVYFTNLVMQ